MLQRIPIALTQVKTGNTSENLLDEIRQIIYSLYQANQITKKLYNNKMNSINEYNIYNSEYSKTSDPHRLLLNLSDKINLKSKDKYVALSKLSISFKWRNIKKSYKNNKFKISALAWNEDFQLPDGSYSVSDISDYFEYTFTKHGENILQ